MVCWVLHLCHAFLLIEQSIELGAGLGQGRLASHIFAGLLGGAADG